MQFDPMIPIWLQISNVLKEEVVAGKLTAGDKLPGGRDLAIRFGVNPNTAARVYQELEREGICVTRRGLGTFITENSQMITELRNTMAKETIQKCLDQLQRLGIDRTQAVEMLKEEYI